MPQRSRRGLATWLADTVTPLFVLDAKRKVLFFNHGCEALTGWSAGDVIGQVCDYVSEPDPSQVESLTGVLCPPPDVFDRVEQSVPAFVINREGKRLARLTQFIPLVTQDGTVDRVLGLILPLREQHQPVKVAADRQLHADLSAVRADLRKAYDITTLIGESAVFRRIVRQVTLARESDVSVHFCGEHGTGREHLARLIHYQSHRRLQAFVPLDCARVTAEVLRSTLERMLRGPDEDEIPHLRPGALFLRNVEQFPADLQQEIIQLWSDAASPPPIRLMSDSTQPMQQAVDNEQLTDEFEQLLASLVIDVPPLRERMDDFSLLAQDMLERHNRDRESQVTGFSEEVWQAFRRYTWPGNQSELQEVVREAREACTGKLVTMAELPFRFRTGQAAQQVVPAPPPRLLPLEERLAEVERDHIRRALELCDNNKSQTAERLGITRPKLYRRMNELGLE